MIYGVKQVVYIGRRGFGLIFVAFVIGVSCSNVGNSTARHSEQHTAIGVIEVNGLPHRKTRVINHNMHTFGKAQMLALNCFLALSKFINPRPGGIHHTVCFDHEVLPA